MDVISINVENAKVFLDGSEEFSDKFNVRQYINLDVLSDIAEVINSIENEKDRLVEYKVLSEDRIAELITKSGNIVLQTTYLVDHVVAENMVEFEVAEDITISGECYPVGTVFVVEKDIINEYLETLKELVERLHDTITTVDFEKRV